MYIEDNTRSTFVANNDIDYIDILNMSIECNETIGALEAAIIAEEAEVIFREDPPGNNNAGANNQNNNTQQASNFQNKKVDPTVMSKVKAKVQKIIQVIKNIVNKIFTFIKSIPTRLQDLMKQAQAKFAKSGIERGLMNRRDNPKGYVYDVNYYNDSVKSDTFGTVAPKEIIEKQLTAHIGNIGKAIAALASDKFNANSLEEFFPEGVYAKAKTELDNAVGAKTSGDKYPGFGSNDNSPDVINKFIGYVQSATKGTILQLFNNPLSTINTYSKNLKTATERVENNLKSAISGNRESEVVKYTKQLNLCRSIYTELARISSIINTLATSVMTNRIKVCNTYIRLWPEAVNNSNDEQQNSNTQNTANTENNTTKSVNIFDKNDISFKFF